MTTPQQISKSPPNRWAVLALLGVAQLMVVLDATIVNIALPSAQHSLHFTTDNRQWIVTAYALSFGSLLLVGGKLGDLFGRKWTLIGGLVGFSIASAIGGLAQSFGMLVAARALQGAFGALLAPSALGLLTVTFQGSQDRAKAFGIFSAIAAGGGSLGLLLGGVLTQAISWRWSLYVNLVIAIPTAIVALRLLQNSRQQVRPRIDFPGVALASSGLFALVYGFSNAETHSWSNPVTIIALVASVLLLGSFALLEQRVKNPLLPLHIVWDRARGGAYVTIALAGSAIFAVFLFLTYYMQQNLGFLAAEDRGRLPSDDRHDRRRRHHRADEGAPAHGRQAARHGRDGARGHRDAPALSGHRARRLRQSRPAGAPTQRDGHGPHLRPRLLDGDARRQVHRRGHRVGDGEYLAAGRRLGGHSTTQHHLRHRREQLRLRPRSCDDADQRRLDSRLLHGV